MWTLDHITAVGGAIALALLLLDRGATLAEKGLFVPGRLGRWWHARAVAVVNADQEKIAMQTLVKLAPELQAVLTTVGTLRAEQAGMIATQARIGDDIGELRKAADRIPAMEETLAQVHTELYPNHGKPSMSDRINAADADRRAMHETVIARLDGVDERLNDGGRSFAQLRDGQHDLAAEIARLAKHEEG